MPSPFDPFSGLPGPTPKKNTIDPRTAFLPTPPEARAPDFSALATNNLRPQPSLPVQSGPVRRTVFISHSHLHESETKAFLREFGSVFHERHIGLSKQKDHINSTNTEYVMRRIREELIQAKSIVTIVLVGSCTHSRRYVDWEIKASLQQGEGRTPNGVLAIQLPSCPNGALLPPRLEENWRRNDRSGYARYYQYPRNKEELRRWIEEAVEARSTITDRIKNSHEMMTYNAKCRVCGVTH